MSENKEINTSAADKNWARQLKRRVGRQISRSAANAIIADELAQALRQQNLLQVEFLLTTPLPSLFSRKPALPHPETAFEDAWKGMSENAREKARYWVPALYDAHRNSPLGMAVLAGFTPGVEMLTAKGACPFQTMPQNPAGYGGPLGAAIFHGKEDLITLLMKQPAVQEELKAEPKFRNYLLLTALGTDCAATLAHLATCDPELMEKGRAYGDRKASDFTLGEGIFAYKEKLKARRAFEAANKPLSDKYGAGPKYRPRTLPENQPDF
ncbi:MAG: hypothetical protein EPN97_13865 [Alphaproteobacteria bacterium]|nr:MAG: hypothetical protein EPN97_13865 [Alphaproteobacteria bacterium]